MYAFDVKTHREIMSTFSVKPHGIDKDSLLQWKKEWLELWKNEKKDEKEKVKIPVKRDSEWDTHEREIPWCPEHYRYCVIDESVKGIQNWNH